MIEAADKKRESILEKAILRFAHFGIQKTTMNEIAEDLAISKPSLYYYFPDKLSMVMAVAEKILNDYLQQAEEKITKADSAQGALFSVIDLRREFFKKYFMLHIGETQGESNYNNPDFKRLLQNVRDREKNLVKALFESRFEEKSSFSFDLAAELYLDTIIGLGICIMGRQEKQLVPDSKGIEEVSAKQKALTEIFLKGLEN